MASRVSIHSQLSSVMETMAKSAFSQVCKLVDQDSAELRSELSRLLFANSALTEKVNSLECELTSVVRDTPKKSRSYCSVVTCPPTIEGIFGKDWCINLWKDRDPYSPQRCTDSPGSPDDEPTAAQSDQVTLAEIKKEELMPNAATNSDELVVLTTTNSDELVVLTTTNSDELVASEEAISNDEHEESMAEELDQKSVDYPVDGSTCSLPLDQGGQQDSLLESTEETLVQFISINDTTEEDFSAHIIPIEVEDDDAEEEEDDDDVQFVQASHNEAELSPAVGPSHDEQQTLPTNSTDNCFTNVKDLPKNLNVVSVKTTRAPKSNTFTCHVCSRTFFHKGTLTHHMKSHKTNFCSICKQHFPQKKLNSHRCVPPVLHQRISKSCELCGKIFANQSALRIHYVVHTGEKPYRCSLCGKRFTQKGNLKCHLRIHTGERPFLCVKCGKTFTQKVNLNHHLMAHLNREVVGGASVCQKQPKPSNM
ncbi:zinc finger protein 300-like isoform X2 [Xiphophorus hellerii]|uniref:zinc finger protein 300-like isoform X2 n=1 Tax=Xiphophorus hellerii TaxID=8084 RepID=UPI0013B38402|nr:zinc finger protein 300-like isoform X2 [Xiphophorus hellerii]